MTRCNHTICENCNCGRKNVLLADNSNFAPVERPKRIVRRDPSEVALRLERRFKETMQILS